MGLFLWWIFLNNRNLCEELDWDRVLEVWNVVFVENLYLDGSSFVLCKN
jgi:alanyl-tRNA synthetase